MVFAELGESRSLTSSSECVGVVCKAHRVSPIQLVSKSRASIVGLTCFSACMLVSVSVLSVIAVSSEVSRPKASASVSRSLRSTMAPVESGTMMPTPDAVRLSSKPSGAVMSAASVGAPNRRICRANPFEVAIKLKPLC